MEVDKNRLIKEIRKRPLLWDFRNFYESRNNKKIDELWQEIGKILGTDVTSSKIVWQKLRTAFFNEMKRIPMRIAKAKRKGTYDASKNYNKWPFFDAIEFIAHGRSVRGINNQGLKVFSDIKIVADNNSDKMQPQNEKKIKNNSFSRESDKTSQIIKENSEQECKKLKSYTMALYTQENEGNTSSNNNNCLAQTLPLNDLVLKKEIDEEFEDEKNFSDNQEMISIKESISSTISKPEKILASENPQPFECLHEREHNSAFLQINITRSVVSSDEDYNFLYGLLSQMQQMSHMQKLQFRANMSSLMLDVFSSSAPVKDLDKRVLSGGDNDPDKKFLISFSPFLKSMSLSQNLQFRAKIVDLVRNILPAGYSN